MGLTIADYVFCNIQSVAANKITLIEYLYNLKDKYADTIIWDKQSAEPAMKSNVLNSQYEYIYIFSNKANRCVGSKEFRGTIPNIFALGSRVGKEFAHVHKATFRVELPEYFINNFANTSVIDLFVGTGTTLIAAEKNNYISYNVELDPFYCDIIVKRWEDFTSKKAFLEKN